MKLRLRIAFVAAFVILGVIYSFATPVFEKNDEESHAWFVHLLATGGDLPVQTPGAPDSALHREGSQPPLYYWLAAAVYRQFDLSDFDAQQRPNQSPQFNPYAPNNKNLLIITPQKRAFNYEKTALATVALRLLGILPGCVAIWMVYGIARAIARDERIALLAMGLTAFNPMFIQVMTALGNDGLVIALATAGVSVMAQGALHGFTARRVAAAGVLIALASLSKVSGALLLPVAAAAIVGREWLRPSADRFSRRALAVLAQGAGIGLIWLILAGWWYARNLQLYGDLTGTSVMAQMMTPRNFTLAQVLSEFQGFRMSYIAMFGQFAVPADGIVYIAFDALLILSGAGLAAWAAGMMGQQKDGEEARRERDTRLLAAGLLAMHVGLLLLSVLRWTMMTPASHGRLIYPGIAGVSTLMALGLAELAARARPPARNTLKTAVTAVVLIPMLALAGASPFIYILPGYTPPLVAQAPADFVPVHQQMGDLAEVLGYRMAPQDARPGERVRVSVAMRALRAERDDYSLVTKLYGRGAALLDRFDTFTGQGLWPSSLWRPGDIFLDEVELRVPVTATAPGILKVQFELYNAGSGDIAPSRDGAGNPGAPLYAGSTLLPAGAAAPAAAIARFGPVGQLDAYDLAGMGRGMTATLRLEWRALQRPSIDYTVFVHVVDEAGHIVAQHDKPPLDGEFPTPRWSAGAVFDDVHRLALPASLPAGRYQVQIGLYDRATGERLPLALGTAAGNARAADGATLTLADMELD